MFLEGPRGWCCFLLCFHSTGAKCMKRQLPCPMQGCNARGTGGVLWALGEPRQAFWRMPDFCQPVFGWRKCGRLGSAQAWMTWTHLRGCILHHRCLGACKGIECFFREACWEAWCRGVPAENCNASRALAKSLAASLAALGLLPGLSSGSKGPKHEAAVAPGCLARA